MDLSTFTIAELKSLLDKVPGEIARREKDEKVRIRKELEELAKKNGYSLNELLGEAAEKVAKVRKTVAIKYRHPDDISLTWTGRGRQPKWMAEFLASGGSIERLAV